MFILSHFTTVLSSVSSVFCLVSPLSPINPFSLAHTTWRTHTHAHKHTHTTLPLVSFVSSDLQSCLICIACRIPRAQPFSTESFITKQDPTGNTHTYTNKNNITVRVPKSPSIAEIRWNI